MKKAFFLSALALVTGLSLTSCKDDTQPRLNPAVDGTFKLYEPANNNYTYDLRDNSFVLTLTTNGQPDYGVATPTNYQVQVSLDDKWEEAVMDPNSGEIAVYPTYYSLPTVNTQSVIEASALELNQAITYLEGIHEEGQEDLYDSSARPIWVRVRAYISDPASEDGYVSYSQIYSNSVKINRVQPASTPSLPLPAKLWVIGKYQDWNIDGNAKTITVDEKENGIGSDIYTGYLYYDTGLADNMFRFYSALGDWENNSIGSQVDDNPIQITMETEGGVTFYNGDCVAGKGSWQITNFPVTAGWLKLTVDLNTMTVNFMYDPDYTPAE